MLLFIGHGQVSHNDINFSLKGRSQVTRVVLNDHQLQSISDVSFPGRVPWHTRADNGGISPHEIAFFFTTIRESLVVEGGKLCGPMFRLNDLKRVLASHLRDLNQLNLDAFSYLVDSDSDDLNMIVRSFCCL